MGNCIASVQQRPVYSRVAEADGNILYFLSKSSGRLADYSICANVFTGFGRHCRTYHSEAWAQRWSWSNRARPGPAPGGLESANRSCTDCVILGLLPCRDAALSSNTRSRQAFSPAWQMYSACQKLILRRNCPQSWNTPVAARGNQTVGNGHSDGGVEQSARPFSLPRV